MKIDGSKNTLDSQNGKAYKARRKGFQAKQKYADGPFLRVYYYVRPAVKQKNRPREFPKGGIAWCTLCTGGEGGMKMFNLIGFGERAGSGIPDIYATWREAGYIEPAVEELFGNDQPNRTIVTLPLTEKDFLPQRYDTGEEKREETREALVISLIKDDPKISMSKMAEQTGYSAKQIEKTIDKLKARGIVSRSGADNGGVWIINE